MRPPLHFKLGELELFVLNDGDIWLDGGSTFGVVPRVIWSQLTEPDEQNRIRLSMNPLLVRIAGQWVLIETGIDRKPGPKHRELYRLGDENPVLAQLASLGVWPEDIAWVINTHLHFDHAGLNTRLEGGRLLPTFPKARYVVQKQELEDATHPHERSRASYLPENIEPVLEADLFEVVEGEAELLGGLRLIPVPGHTLGMQAVELESEGQRLAFTADLVPTLMQTPLPYIMAFDLYPMTTLETRKKMYVRWLEGDYLLCFTHEPGYPLGRLIQTERGYRAEPAPGGEAIGLVL
ncbi:MBL fold metallo-hydrolase [Calidithermus timidus]|jgi:glyoxylase-like metal-dependent hydrolase (beta-lactamase superfamily II)|uniref:MBL fold metallo-hydrolase n=1 Tax=Calidithermus timidus TaxID=307124 RepID=UPI000379FB2D|nr:MBL fold metallo-hydrolase [Calidithermus timidus]